MSAIPSDIDKVAAEVWATLPKEGAGITAIARAILAERERCADVARRYLEDIAGCNMSEDEPERIAASIMDPKWEPPPL